MTDADKAPDTRGDGSERIEPALDADRLLAGRPLDPSADPDRFDPDRLDASVEPSVEPALVPPPRLDPARDPDRFRAGDRTLTEMLGDGAQEEARDTYVWLLGLLSMLVFLGLVALVARNLGP